MASSVCSGVCNKLGKIQYIASDFNHLIFITSTRFTVILANVLFGAFQHKAILKYRSIYLFLGRGNPRSAIRDVAIGHHCRVSLTAFVPYTNAIFKTEYIVDHFTRVPLPQ